MKEHPFIVIEVHSENKVLYYTSTRTVYINLQYSYNNPLYTSSGILQQEPTVMHLVLVVNWALGTSNEECNAHGVEISICTSVPYWGRIGLLTTNATRTVFWGLLCNGGIGAHPRCGSRRSQCSTSPAGSLDAFDTRVLQNIFDYVSWAGSVIDYTECGEWEAQSNRYGWMTDKSVRTILNWHLICTIDLGGKHTPYKHIIFGVRMSDIISEYHDLFRN